MEADLGGGRGDLAESDGWSTRVDRGSEAACLLARLDTQMGRLPTVQGEKER